MTEIRTSWGPSTPRDVDSDLFLKGVDEATPPSLAALHCAARDFDHFVQLLALISDGMPADAWQDEQVQATLRLAVFSPNRLAKWHTHNPGYQPRPFQAIADR